MKTRTWLGVGFAAVWLVPPIVFFWAAWSDGLGAGEAFAALAAQYGAARRNLAVLSALGLAPFVLLVVVLLVMRRVAPLSPYRPIYAVAGLLPILLVLAWVHGMFWPLFFPEGSYPGFPHGLELIIGPFVFAPVAMTVGLLAAWMVLKARR